MRITRNPARGSGGNSTYTPDSLPGYRGGGGGGPVFDPTTLVGVGDTALIIDPTDRSTMFQDVLKTAFASTTGDPVRAIVPLAHAGTQCPDMLAISSTLIVTDAGVSTGGMLSVLRSDLDGTIGTRDFSNGGTIVVGVIESIEQRATYWDAEFSGTTALARRSIADGDQMNVRYADSAFQAVAGVPRGTFPTVSDLVLTGDSSTGKFYRDGVQYGSDFSVGNPSAGNSLIYGIDIGRGTIEGQVIRSFWIDRELSVEDLLQVCTWVKG